MRKDDFIDGHMHGHDAREGSLHADDHSGSYEEDSTAHAHRLDLGQVRAKLREKSGKQYWRTPEELADIRTLKICCIANSRQASGG